MKKVSLLVLLAILASTLLMAAIPTAMVRLTIINKSGYDVYMKLTGSAVTDAFYYLTVPAGDRDNPTVKVFTVMTDLYDRETWQCNGVRSAGSLVVDGNLKLTFTPCFEKACECANYYTFTKWCGCGTDPQNIEVGVTKRKAGEPRMEKVTYFKYLYTRAVPFWDAYNLNLYGFKAYGCGLWAWRIRSYQLPVGCEWRYQY